MLDLNQADALAADDILIMGFLESRGLRDRYIMVGDALTQDLYGITFPRDPALDDAVKVQVALDIASKARRITDCDGYRATNFLVLEDVSDERR